MIHFVKTLFGASRYKRKLTAYKKKKKERKKERLVTLRTNNGDTTHTYRKPSTSLPSDWEIRRQREKTNHLRQKKERQIATRRKEKGERETQRKERQRNREAENREQRRRERLRDQKLHFAIQNEKMSLTSCQIASSNCLLISFHGIKEK